ncbi:efflux RND transporter periplasmic adaptor subunit [uncultured Flavobacterium sp.]|uniref:efflux RND transporter periplasmic adaptor subunit n=1 Tax=uncultured Flavobacterium sp. TaxID=165435 RepID=UPI0030CA5B0E|tara:strand:+ start:1923 stop:3215 length:1293 start_codon:yes stop_codon:yes gene_type:complete
MSKKTIFILLGAIIVIVAGIIIFGKGKNDDTKIVEIAKANKMTLVETVSATGKIQPEVEVKISSEVSGEVIALPIKEGQQVKKGDLLVKINPDIYVSGVNRASASVSNTKAGLSQVDAQVKEAKANYDRNKTLFNKGVISKSEWDRIVSAYEVAGASKQSAYFNVQSALATLTEARDNLGRTTIYAPADGTVSLLSIELGERVLGTQQMAGTEILRIANLNNMEVEVDVNENDIVKVTIGDQADIEVDAYLKRKFKGTVTSISNSANSALTADQVTNFKVKIRIEKDSYSDLLEGRAANYSPFRPGMTATVDIITEKKVDIIAVPISAVVIKEDTTSVKKDILAELEKEEQLKKGTAPKTDEKFECVFVKVGDKAKLRVIKTGIQDDTNIEIISGLKKGEEIIVGPYTTVSKDLMSNDKVRLENKDDKTK